MKEKTAQLGCVQVAQFRCAYFIKFHKKIFKMAPLHHHFEKLGWEENDIVKMFWIVGLILAMLMITYNVWL